MFNSQKKIEGKCKRKKIEWKSRKKLKENKNKNKSNVLFSHLIYFHLSLWRLDNFKRLKFLSNFTYI